jgi:DNA-binding response OmpR family regulator
MRERGTDIPLLVMTAGREARRVAQEVRAAGYVGKPFDIDELERAVRAALAGRGGELFRAAFVPPLPAILRGVRRAPAPRQAAPRPAAGRAVSGTRARHGQHGLRRASQITPI